MAPFESCFSTADPKMNDAFELLRVLADGKPQSCAALARHFGVDAAVIRDWREQLSAVGLELDVLRGLRYRLKQPLELLDAGGIRQALDSEAQRFITSIEVAVQMDSTNARLMRQGASGVSTGRVCLAEMQTAGRGQRGNQWISPLAANLYMSLLWPRSRAAASMGRLCLLVAIAVADALTAFGVQDLRLKWPNDLLWCGRKLGGILVETAGNAGENPYIVIGVGINVRMPSTIGARIEQPWTDLSAALKGQTPSRNLLAGRLLNSMIAALQQFGHTCGANLVEAWGRYDLLRGQTVELQTPMGRERGTALGIDAEGRLMLEVNGRQQAHTSGEVSLSAGAALMLHRTQSTTV